ncbi:predicted bacteriophage P4 integrase [Desulforapulum autotrophicum HRM2]|uniref:Predicted bacteriophage P4 integrase n=1 Tax=Desulforapulum autotrophicum (strain ATCC 43914 / DSM 3382 / VKM B-1955 / HRM2) TaxID=177437 RepID=C0QBZ6_DESAH|nr:site-specific integrase [Desulforapulum autotrophicum]ACN15008.1 predicted bacteriophage P4 integrase [Desulforapulum autotrophicum HRM2]
MANKTSNKNMYQDPASGVWYFQKKVRGLPKPYKFSLDTKSVVEARKKRDEYLLEVKVNGFIQKNEVVVVNPEDGTCFGEIAVQWAELKKTKVSKSTIQEYRKVMNKYILPQFGNRRIDSITGLEIEVLVSKLKCGGKTKNNILTPFKDVMRFAKKHKLIQHNPFDDVDSIKRESSEIHPLSLGEIKLFLEHVPDYYRPLFTFLFFTGARFGEAAALKWKRVDLTNGMIHIAKTYVRGEYKDPKTKGSIRTVKLSPIVIDALHQQREHTMDKSEFVFLNTLGRHIHPHSVNLHVFRPTLEKAGLSANKSFSAATRRSCKDTRSSYITNSLDNNERMGFVQKQVGHTTTKMIVEHYYRHLPAPDDGKGLEKAIEDFELQKVEGVGQIE